MSVRLGSTIPEFALDGHFAFWLQCLVPSVCCTLTDILTAHIEK